MEYTFRGKVTQHKVQKDDNVYSVVEITNPTNPKYLTIDIIVPLKFLLASQVYVTVSDSEPEGGAA